MQKTTGHQLRKLRKEYNLTQKQIADYLGTETSKIKELENNNETLSSSSLTKLCDLYGCQPEDILTGNYSLKPMIKSDDVDLNTLASMNRIIRNLKQLHELNSWCAQNWIIILVQFLFEMSY